MGHEVKLMPPSYVKPYVKRGKNGGNGAEACCEAVSRPMMRFVPVKSAGQQATLMLHKTREPLIKQRTMNVNALRGHLAEFGAAAAKGIARVEALVEKAGGGPALPAAAKTGMKLFSQQIAALTASIGEAEKEIARLHAQDETSQLLDEIPGIGAIIATAIVASLPDPGVFTSARGFSAWLGLTPRQNSTGGKERLGSITKQGNRYIRKLLIAGAASLPRVAAKHKGQLAGWIVALRAKKPARLVSVALANKLARIVFAMMTSGEAFRKESFARA